jgi:hypothetical protein
MGMLMLMQMNLFAKTQKIKLADSYVYDASTDTVQLKGYLLQIFKEQYKLSFVDAPMPSAAFIHLMLYTMDMNVTEQGITVSTDTSRPLGYNECSICDPNCGKVPADSATVPVTTMAPTEPVTTMGPTEPATTMGPATTAGV